MSAASARKGAVSDKPPRERYYVQAPRLNDPLMEYAVNGWLTPNVYADRETAQRFADSLDWAQVWLDGEDVTAQTATVARVVSATELREQDGPEALAAAEAATGHRTGQRPLLNFLRQSRRKRLWQRRLCLSPTFPAR